MANGCAQRAYVDGYCREVTMDAITAAILGTDLVMLSRPLGKNHWVSVPITIDDGAAFTFAGRSLGSPEVIADEFGGTLSERLVADLARCWFVGVLDPVWGRADLLWSVLASALRQR
jgi:hypothetical protein